MISVIRPARYTCQCLALGVIWVATSSLAYAEQNLRTISVSGEHQQMVEADQYEISVDLIARAKNRDDLKEKLAVKRKAMNKLIKQFNLAEQDAGYTRADLREEFKWQNNERKLVGYSLQESWWLKVNDARVNGQILDQLAATNEVDAYRSAPRANGKQLYRNALAFALNDAKQKARIMAQELGTCLGQPHSIREEQGGRVAPHAMMMKSTMEMADSMPEARVNSQARVHVVWQLKDC